MNGYTKLFSSILTSSIWNEDDTTRIVWVTLMAMADKDGIVRSSLTSLALFARVTKEAAERAVAKLMAPDPESGSKEKEGRRIEVVDGGWHLINHGKYRDLMSLEERREYYRKKRAEYRAKEKAARTGMTSKQIVNERVEARDKLQEGE